MAQQPIFHIIPKYPPKPIQILRPQRQAQGHNNGLPKPHHIRSSGKPFGLLIHFTQNMQPKPALHLLLNTAQTKAPTRKPE